MRYFKHIDSCEIYETPDKLNRIVSVYGLYEKDEDGELIETLDEYYDLGNDAVCFDAGGWGWGSKKEYYNENGSEVDLNDYPYSEGEFWHDGHNFRLEIYIGGGVFGSEEYDEITDDLCFSDIRECKHLANSETKNFTYKQYYKDHDGNLFIYHRTAWQGSRDSIEEVSYLWESIKHNSDKFITTEVLVEDGLYAIVCKYDNVYFSFIDHETGEFDYAEAFETEEEAVEAISKHLKENGYEV